MKFDPGDLDWDRHNRQHLARHAEVSVREVEEAMALDCIIVAAAVAGGERRYEFVGATAAGRVLVVIATPRHGKMRPITAYPAEGRRLRIYQQRDQEQQR